MVIDTVLASAWVEARVLVACPPPSVAAAGWTSVLPLPVAAKTTLAAVNAEIALLCASLAVTVMVVAAEPLAATLPGLAEIVELPALTAPGVKVTEAVGVMGVPLMVTDTVLLSALVEASVAVVRPLASVAALGCTSVLPVPVAANTTLAAAIPGITLLLASFAVTVRVLVAPPSVETLVGLAEIVELLALTAPGTTVNTPEAPVKLATA